MEDCLFCKIISGEIPSFKVWENDKYLAFLDRYPETEGMTIIVPKKHYPGYFADVPKDVLADLLEAAQEITTLLDTKLEGVLRTMLVFEGLDIDHIHLKLIPAYKGKVTPHETLDLTVEELEQTHKKLTN